MNDQNSNNDLCFVIGPMGEYLERMKKFSNEVIAPIVGPLGYYVMTPDEPLSGNIMGQVIKLLDRAKMVIVDLSGARPNVLYELGIVHSLGRPYVLVFETKGPLLGKDVPFDLGAYRHVEIERFDAIEDAQKELKSALERIHSEIAENRLVSNPVTDYYKAPLTKVQSSERLAGGYYVNFVKRIVELAISGKGIIKIDNEDIVLDGSKPLKLEVVIPDRIRRASRPNMEDLFSGRGMKAYSARPDKDTNLRPYTGYVRPELDREFRLLDIPTPLYSMEDSIEARLGPVARSSSDTERLKLEKLEIDRFVAEVKWLIDEDELLMVKDMVKFIKFEDFLAG